MVVKNGKTVKSVELHLQIEADTSHFSNWRMLLRGGGQYGLRIKERAWQRHHHHQA